MNEMNGMNEMNEMRERKCGGNEMRERNIIILYYNTAFIILNVKYAKTKIQAETGICLGVICWRVSSREDIERWQQQRWQCDANSAKNEKSESIYQEGFSQR